MEFSEYVEPEEKVHQGNAIAEKLMGCPVGKAFVISGVKRSIVTTRLSNFMAANKGYKFSSMKLSDTETQVTRIS